jgi:hypothetical protein
MQGIEVFAGVWQELGQARAIPDIYWSNAEGIIER